MHWTNLKIILCPRYGLFSGICPFLKSSTFGRKYLSFGPIMTKLAPIFNFPKILTMIEYYWVGARFDGETAAQMAKKLPITPYFFLFSSSRARVRAVWSLGDDGATNQHYQYLRCHHISYIQHWYFVKKIVDRFLFLASNNFATFCHSLLINIKSKE